MTCKGMNPFCIYSFYSTCTEDYNIECTHEECECVWESWESWSECSRTCDGGTRIRERTFVPSSNTNNMCNGSSCEMEFCSSDNCQGMNCVL